MTNTQRLQDLVADKQQRIYELENELRDLREEYDRLAIQAASLAEDLRKAREE